MTPAELITVMKRDGAELSLTPSGRLRITGADALRFLPIVRQYEAELVAELQAAGGHDTPLS